MNEVEKVGKYGTWGKILLKFETTNELGEVGISLEQNSQIFFKIWTLDGIEEVQEMECNKIENEKIGQ